MCRTHGVLIFFFVCPVFFFFFFFFNDTATTEIYTLSLHDALPISIAEIPLSRGAGRQRWAFPRLRNRQPSRSEEHTSELQSQSNLVCRLLLEKKKKKKKTLHNNQKYNTQTTATQTQNSTPHTINSN